MTYVYAIQSNAGTVKIGMSKSPERRLHAVRKYIQSDIVFVAEHHEAPSVEARTHLILNSKRYRNEWFRISAAEAETAIRQAIREVDAGWRTTGRVNGVGRPPLNNVATNIRLTKEMKQRIDALVGGYNRAQFIREAIDEKLAREPQDKT